MKTKHTFFILAVFCSIFYESVAQTDTAYINKVLGLSDSLTSEKQYKAAFAQIREAETQLRAGGDTTSALFGKAILKKGIWLYKQEDYEGAFKVLRHSIDIHNALPQPKVINTAGAHQAIANVCFEIGELQLGLNHLDTALAIVIFVRKTEKHLGVASIYNNQAAYYIAMTRYKEALACHQKALAIRKSFSQAPAYNDAVASSFYGIGTLYHRMGENRKALIYLDSSLTIRNNLERKDYDKIHNVLNAKGACYFALGMLDSSILLHKQVLTFRQKTESALSDLANIYQNIANDYQEFGMLDSAIHYHQGALALRNKLFKDKKNTAIADCYHNLGICYESLGQFDFALGYFRQALDIWEPLPDKTALCLVHRKIGEVLFKQNKPEEGLEHLEQGIKTLLEMEHPDTSLLFGVMGTKGDALIKVGRLNDAHQIYTEALEIARHNYGTNTLSEARCLVALGDIERERGNSKEAISLHRLALETNSVKLPGHNERLANNYLSLALDYAASENDVLSSVFFEKALKAIGFETSNIDLKAVVSIETALECLDQKGAYHFKNYTKSGLLTELREANNTYQDYSKVLTGLLYETNQAEALSGIIDRAKPAMEAAMSIAAALSQKTADQAHLETCFQWMELSQNLTLLRSIRRSNIDFSKHVDPAMLQQEKETFQKIHRLRYKRDSLIQNNATYNEARINQINTQIFEQQIALEHVLQQIRTSYPEYARITQRVDPVSLRAVQEKELQSNQALIVFEYAATQNRLFILYA
ncbi:MAG: tetratricopeptide repeat protein, partial [Saprospiraceae bacterium]|nr:tetratricopeptide repeat protein [Saprospiraceae bacterium]